MTICIAAACREGEERKIILCSDWQSSTSFGSAEVAYKQHYLGKGWYALGSGFEDDIIALRNIVRNKFKNSDEIDETNVITLINDSIRERKAQKIEEYVSAKFGISYKEFLSVGRDKFPPEMFREYLSEISKIDIDATLILSGFDPDGFPLICETIYERGYLKTVIKENFAAIGEGTYLALTALLHREYMDVNELPKAIYKIFEAKCYAERVKSVGQYTSITVLSADRSTKRITSKTRKYLREKYEEYGPQPIKGITLDKGFFEE